MTSEITSAQDSAYLEIQFKGSALISGFDSAFQALLAHPGWKSGKAIILNLSDLNFVEFTSSDMRKISELVVRHRSSFGKSRWAFVISGNLQFGLMRMWEIITEDRVPMIINLFKSRAEAQEWISITNEKCYEKR